MRIFENLNIDFLGKRKLFYGVSAAVFLLGMLSIIFRGFQFGIDFKGGSEIVIEFEKPIDIANLRNSLSEIGLGSIEVKTFGAETGVLIRTEIQDIPVDIYPKVKDKISQDILTILPGVPFRQVDSALNSVTYGFDNADTARIISSGLFAEGFQASRESDDIANRNVIVRVGVADWVKENLRTTIKDNPFKVLREDRIGPKVGAELKRDATIAVILALVGILIYLAFRFKFIFAAGAVAALFHDVLLTIGLFSLLYNVIPGLNLEIDLTIVAAFLTLVGYSINDSVIVFDRVRENLQLHKTGNLYEQINLAINKTMSRTIITGITTILALLILMFFGGEVLRAFAFTLFFGIIVGTYSSIFVASALVLEYSLKSKKSIEF